jgi:hypothetical protein
VYRDETYISDSEQPSARKARVTGSTFTLPHLLFRQFHGLPTADKLTLADMKNLNDIATAFTCIHLMFFSHTISFWFVLDFPL